MSGLPDLNFPAFAAAAARLRAAGHKVVDPAEKGIVDGWAWEDYLRWDLRELLDCEGVATLPGWANSRGARFEVRVARDLALPIRPVARWLA